jgi:hypothetical protein
MDDEMQALDIRDFEIERRLDAFARARLSADPQVTARTRARVMREVRLQHEAARDAARAAAPVPLIVRGSTVRRVGTPLLAASMWLAIAVGSVAAAQAGGPLYPTRLWLEQATLPSGGSERTAAEIGRLETRLADALTAAARGDTSAVAAALAAYDSIAAEALAAANGNADLEAIVAAALDRHRAVLTAVAASLDELGNSTAAAAVELAIERSIEHNAAVVQRIGAGQPTGSGTNAGAGTTTGGSTGSTTGGSGDSTTGGTTTGGQTGGDQSSSGSGSGDQGDGGAKPSRSPKPTPEPTAPRDPNHTQRSNQ